MNSYYKNIRDESGYYRNSLTAKWLEMFYNCFRNSRICGVFTVIWDFSVQSTSNRLLRKYLLHSWALPGSRTHAVCSSMFSAVDRRLDGVYRFLKNCFESSATVKFFVRILAGFGSLLSASMFVLCFSCAYGIASMLMGTFNNFRFVIMVSGILLSLFLLVGKPRWAACAENSLFRRIFLYFLD